MAASKEEIWDSLVAHVRNRMPREKFEKLFPSLSLKSWSNEEAVIAVDGDGQENAVKSECLSVIEEAFLDVSGARPVITFVTRGGESGAGKVEIELSSRGGMPTVRLNPSYTFERFIKGPSNMLAHAAAVAVSEFPGEAYNPLFIHSGVGLGKTHLLHAVCHSLLSKRSGASVIYVSCDEFVNSYLSAVQKGGLENFRARFRGADVLLVDDIHFLANREQTQEEFFQIFNTLYNAGKQIILSSDSPPHEIPQLEERLVSRFKWGFVSEIEAPAYETRLSILRQKAEIKGRSFPDNVIEFLASKIASNIRELEGAVTKLVAYSALLNKTVDMGAVGEIFPELVAKPAARRISVDSIYDAVVSYYKMPLSVILSKDRSKTVARVRQVAMFLMHELTSFSLEEIGSRFGGRDHSTVKHACDKIKEEIGGNQSAEEEVSRIREIIEKNSLKNS